MGRLLNGSLLFAGWTPPAEATARIEVLDVTHIDASSESVAAAEVPVALATTSESERLGPFRLRFELSAPDPDPACEYIVSVTVRTPEAIVGRTEIAYPVLTYGHPSRGLEIPVVHAPKHTNE